MNSTVASFTFVCSDAIQATYIQLLS